MTEGRTSRYTKKAMESAYEEIKRNGYRRTLNDVLTTSRSEFTAVLENLHKIWKSGDYKGKRLLEVGSDMLVHNIASASAYFEEIIQSDFDLGYCKRLQKWIKQGCDLEFLDCLKIVAEIEGYSDVDQGVNLISSRIQQCVKYVVHGDVTSEQVFFPEIEKDFDAIISCLMLEVVAKEFASYVEILRKLHGFLRPGGVLIVVGILNGAQWTTGDDQLKHVRLGQSDVKRALELAQFNIKEFFTVPRGTEEHSYQYGNFYMATCISI